MTFGLIEIYAVAKKLLCFCHRRTGFYVFKVLQSLVCREQAGFQKLIHRGYSQFIHYACWGKHFRGEIIGFALLHGCCACVTARPDYSAVRRVIKDDMPELMADELHFQIIRQFFIVQNYYFAVPAYSERRKMLRFFACTSSFKYFFGMLIRRQQPVGADSDFSGRK